MHYFLPDDSSIPLFLHHILLVIPWQNPPTPSPTPVRARSAGCLRRRQTGSPSELRIASHWCVSVGSLVRVTVRVRAMVRVKIWGEAFARSPCVWRLASILKTGAKAVHFIFNPFTNYDFIHRHGHNLHKWNQYSKICSYVLFTGFVTEPEPRSLTPKAPPPPVTPVPKKKPKSLQKGYCKCSSKGSCSGGFCACVGERRVCNTLCQCQPYCQNTGMLPFDVHFVRNERPKRKTCLII